MQEPAQQHSASEESGQRPATKGPLLWLRWVNGKLRRADRESYVCYALFIILFITDFSLLALVLQILLFCYALLAQPPARLFWQVGPSLPGSTQH